MLQVKNRTPAQDVHDHPAVRERRPLLGGVGRGGTGGVRPGPVPAALALDFGSVQFTKLAALGNSAGGTLTSNPDWTSTSVSLVPTGERGYFPGLDRFSRRQPPRPARPRRADHGRPRIHRVVVVVPATS